MGETPDQIERHIYEERSELSENIHELEAKVRTAVDWRAQFDQRPLLMMGIALGGGMVLSMLFGRNSSRRPDPGAQWRRESQPSGHGSSPQEWQDKTDSTWTHLREAFVAVTASRIGTLIEGVLPGFQEQFRRRQEGRESGQRERRSGLSRHNGPETPSRRAVGETEYLPQS